MNLCNEKKKRMLQTIGLIESCDELGLIVDKNLFGCICHTCASCARGSSLPADQDAKIKTQNHHVIMFYSSQH